MVENLTPTTKDIHMGQNTTATFSEIKRHSSVRHSTTLMNMHALSCSDFASQLMNIQIINNIESYYRTINETEREVFLYLCYYYRRWNGNIQISIKNIMNRFNKSERWVHKFLKLLYDKGLFFTVKGGFGRKITKRTLSERGKILQQAIIKGFGSVKQLIQQNRADYRADYSGDHTNNISTKVDILQGEPLNEGFKTEEKIEIPDANFIKSCIKRMREVVNKVKNE